MKKIRFLIVLARAFLPLCLKAQSPQSAEDLAKGQSPGVDLSAPLVMTVDSRLDRSPAFSIRSALVELLLQRLSLGFALFCLFLRQRDH